MLREKASFRNPDEFYFSMEHAKTKNGVHIVDNSRRGGKDAYTEKQLGQFRKTDLQYLQLRTQIERKVFLCLCLFVYMCVCTKIQLQSCTSLSVWKGICIVYDFCMCSCRVEACISTIDDVILLRV